MIRHVAFGYSGYSLWLRCVQIVGLDGYQVIFLLKYDGKTVYSGVQKAPEQSDPFSDDYASGIVADAVGNALLGFPKLEELKQAAGYDGQESQIWDYTFQGITVQDLRHAWPQVINQDHLPKRLVEIQELPSNGIVVVQDRPYRVFNGSLIRTDGAKFCLAHLFNGDELLLLQVAA